MGDIMEVLKLEGLEEDTVILFSSDNGGAGAKYNKPLRGRKEFLYEGGTRVGRGRGEKRRGEPSREEKRRGEKR